MVESFLPLLVTWAVLGCTSLHGGAVGFELELEASLNRKEYVLGDPIWLTVTLVNADEVPLPVDDSEGGPKRSGLRVHVRHVQGATDCERTEAYWPSSIAGRLMPGKSVTWRLNLNKLFRITEPGRYACLAHYANVYGIVVFKENGEVDQGKAEYRVDGEAKAPEISFTVKPDDGKEAARLLNMLRSTDEKAARAAELLNDAPIRVVRDCAEEVWSQVQKRDGQAKEKLLLFFVRNEKVFRDIITGETLVEQLRWISKCENDTLRLLAAQTFRTWRGALRLDALLKFQESYIHDWFRREENPKCRMALMKIGLPKDALLAVARNDSEAQVRLAALKLFARRDIYGFLEISDSFAEAEDTVVVDGKETTLGEAVRSLAENVRYMLEVDQMPLERPAPQQ